MMGLTMLRWMSVLLCLAPLHAQSGQVCPGSPAVPEITQGVRAFKNAQYAAAVSHLRAAVDLDGNCLAARLYLATAYMQQYIPGADSPDNQQMAASAREQFAAVLDQEPENTLAMASLASLFFNMKRFDGAETWYKRLIAVDPRNKEAHYTLGVIAWTRTFEQIQAARQASGMKPDDPGPIRSDDARDELRAKVLPALQNGLDDLNQALAIDPEYDDAMAYMCLLLRAKADLEESADDYKDDVAKADAWAQKAIETRKIKASRPVR